MKIQLLLLIFSAFLQETLAVDCPTLDCTDKPREDGLCFQHSANNPVTSISFYSCNDGLICDLDYTQSSKDMAWVNSTQQYRTQSSDKNLSSVYMRRTSAYCVSKEKFKINLMAGRQCMHNSQCYQRSCIYGVCRGKSSGEACAKHEECDIGLACRDQLEWPFNTLCLPLKLAGEQCSDDYDCQMDYKCWYPSGTHVYNQTKQCMKAYGLPDGSIIGYKEEFNTNHKHANLKSNGRVCQSMFAVPSSDNNGVCASYGTNDSKQCQPFQTKAAVVSQTNCKYSYNQQSVTESVHCDCTLMGGEYGRCPWASKETHILYTQKMKLLYPLMDFCHSKDRDNLIAFGECGYNGRYNTDWHDSVRAQLEMEIYAQRLGDSQITCIDSYHPLSLSNLLKTYYSFDEITQVLYSYGLLMQKIGALVMSATLIISIY